MDGSSVIFIVMPIVIALVLFTSIALLYIANSRSGRRHRDRHAALAVRQGKGPVRPRPRVVIVGGGCAAPTRTSRSSTAMTITRSSRCFTRSAPATWRRKKSAPRSARSSAGRPTCGCASVK
jgi:hypothetical protein